LRKAFSRDRLLDTKRMTIRAPARESVHGLVINAGGGGLLHDVLARGEPLVFKPGQHYALAALAGAIGFLILSVAFGMDGTGTTGLAIGPMFLLRSLTMRLKWRANLLISGLKSNYAA
jgi:uncharacterized membrane protein YeiH